MDLLAIDTNHKDLNWEESILYVMQQKEIIHKKNRKEYLQYRMLLRMVYKVSLIENNLNYKEIQLLRKMIEDLINELLKKQMNIKDQVKRIGEIRKYMKSTFFLVDHNYYKIYALKISFLLSPIFSFLYPSYFFGLLINMALGISIGVFLDMQNKQKGITI